LWGSGNVDQNGMPTSEYLYNTAAMQFFSALGNPQDVALLLAGGVDPGRTAEFMGRAGGGLAAQGFNEQSRGQTLANLASALQGGKLQFQRGSQDRYGGPSSTATFDIDLSSQAGQSVMSRLVNLLPDEQKIPVLQSEIGKISREQPTIAQQEILKTLTDQLKQLTDATTANTDATRAQTDVLSPFYSSDPRRTHLGFRAFAGGGIMTQFGELPLRHYQGGGMATEPQVAVFGEGSTPEAYVPVPAGRIPVEIKSPANSNQKQRPVNVFINVRGSADQGTVAALRSTAFQQAQAMRRAMS
jgi:hypothetical protein